jgi:hypothetical protein
MAIYYVSNSNRYSLDPGTTINYTFDKYIKIK